MNKNKLPLFDNRKKQKRRRLKYFRADDDLKTFAFVTFRF